MAKVGRMNVVVTAGTSGLSRGLRRAESDIDKFVRVGGTAAKFLGGKFRPGLNAAGKGLAVFGASAAASATATALAIKSGADRIDDLADSSKRLLGNNGATGALAGLRFAAEEAGVEAGALDKGMGKLLDTISRANRGDKGAIQAFQRIGLDAQKLQQLRPEDRMIAVADALGKVRDAGDKISLSKGIFGKAGEGLVPLFNEGGDAIRAATKDMELFGHAVNGLDAEKVGTMNDQIGRLKLAWEGVTMQLAVQFAPLVTDISERLLGTITNANGVGSAVENAFDSGVSGIGRFLDWTEDMNISWLKFKRTVTGVGIILKDITSIVTQPITDAYDLIRGDETKRRMEGIAPGKREEFKRLLDESGGFTSEKYSMRGGLVDENRAIQQEIADAEKRRAEKGSLGERFVAWEQAAQTKGAASAAIKLNEMAEKRLGAEESIAKELEKQTKEIKEQKGITSAGQGSLALIAFNGVGSQPVPGKSGKDAVQESAKRPTDTKAVGMLAAKAISAGPKAIAASSEQEMPPVAATAANVAGDWGSKNFWQRELFGGEVGKKYDEKRINPDRMERKYWNKIPGSKRDYKDHMGQSMLSAAEQDPNHRPKWMDKAGDSMQQAMNGDPVGKSKAAPGDSSAMRETNMLLREVRDSLRGGVPARYA